MMDRLYNRLLPLGKHEQRLPHNPDDQTSESVACRGAGHSSATSDAWRNARHRLGKFLVLEQMMLIKTDICQGQRKYKPPCERCHLHTHQSSNPARPSRCSIRGSIPGEQLTPNPHEYHGSGKNPEPSVEGRHQGTPQLMSPTGRQDRRELGGAQQRTLQAQLRAPLPLY